MNNKLKFLLLLFLLIFIFINKNLTAFEVADLNSIENTHIVIKKTLHDHLIPIVDITLKFLSVLFVFILTTYLLSAIKHNRHRKYFLKKYPKIKNIFVNLLNGEQNISNISLSKKELIILRNIILDEFKTSQNEKLKTFYIKLNFYKRDIVYLRKKIWWKKIQAIKRLEIIKINDSDKYVLPFLKDKKIEIRFTALKMLALFGNKTFYESLPDIFNENSRWLFRAVVNILYATDIPIKYLKPLTESSDRDVRKAATMLLGKNSSEESIQLLSILSDDKVKDIRREALRSLSNIENEKTVPIFIRKSNDENPQIKSVVADFFGKLNNPDYIYILDKFAYDNDFYVRLHSFYALDKMGEQGRSIIEKHKNREPRMAQEFLMKAENGKYSI